MNITNDSSFFTSPLKDSKNYENLPSLNDTGHFCNDLNLKNEIKNLDASFVLNGFPSFQEILNQIQNSNIVSRIMFNLNKIILIRQKDNETKMELFDKLSKFENEKNQCEALNTKLRSQISELSEKIKRIEINCDDKKQKTDDMNAKLKSELEQISKHNQQLMQREVHFSHEIKERKFDK